MNVKYFIITVDTEGDNLWEYREGEHIGVKNSEYIPRFQNLCDSYGFKPVYLTNYEMAKSSFFISSAKKWLAEGRCEIGIHLHAWNNPPLFELNGEYSGNPYLIEYEESVMREKFAVIYDLIKTNFGIEPVSHRAGRWAMDDRYFKILEDYDIRVDCSYTPGVDWTTAKGATRGGSNYLNKSESLQMIGEVMEVPVTIRHFRNCINGSCKHRIKSILKGENVWLRPALSNALAMKKVIDLVLAETNVDYVEFMLHSSELMPNGSPYFRTEEAIEKEYQTMKDVFTYAISKGYVGATLEEYFKIKKQDL